MKDYVIAIVGIFGVLVGAIATSLGDYMIDEGSAKRAVQLDTYREYVNSQGGNDIVKSQRKIAIYGQLEIAKNVAAVIAVDRADNICDGDRWLPTIELNRAIRKEFHPDSAELSNRDLSLLLMGCVPPTDNA